MTPFLLPRSTGCIPDLSALINPRARPASISLVVRTGKTTRAYWEDERLQSSTHSRQLRSCRWDHMPGRQRQGQGGRAGSAHPYCTKPHPLTLPDKTCMWTYHHPVGLMSYLASDVVTAILQSKKNRPHRNQALFLSLSLSNPSAKNRNANTVSRSIKKIPSSSHLRT